MEYLLLAFPFFFLMFFVELVVDRRRGTGYIRWSDSINSLSMGALSELGNVVTAAVGILTYVWVYEHFAQFELSAESWWVWVVGFLLRDLTYYWGHRMGHEINVLWAAHVVHHQSEEFNISTALRQESTTFLLYWVFALPMAVLGIPPLVSTVVVIFILYYQVWIHTRHIPKLGWFEWIFNTPSHHRVHHGQNPVYLDRNYAGVLIIWDKLFGTYQKELDAEPVVYGITVPLASWNPLWGVVHVYVQLWRDAVHAASWWDKLRIWFMPTGWRPADVAERYPSPKQDLVNFVRFDVPLATRQKAYALFQFAVYALCGTWFILNGGKHSAGEMLFAVSWVALGLYAIGVGLENRPWVGKLELVRLVLNVPALWAMQHLDMVPTGETAWLVLLSYSVVCGIFLGLPKGRVAELT